MENIHHITRYGNVISCGATGPVRVEEFAKDVTCPACKAADYQHLIDNAHEQALEDDAERTEAHREQWRDWRDRMWTSAVRLNAATPNMSIAELSLIEEAHAEALEIESDCAASWRSNDEIADRFGLSVRDVHDIRRAGAR